MIEDSDRQSFKAQAVADLLAALLSGDGVAGALRACWYRHPLFASTLMSESMRRQYPPGCDLRLVTAFVSRIRARQQAVPCSFPSREAEAVIRACLGELNLLEEVHPARFNYPEIGIAILGELFDEWCPEAEELAEWFQHVERATRAMREAFPDLESGEADWFSIEMHRSPFAHGLGDLSDGQSEEG